MSNALRPDSPELRAGLNRLYREFFDRAEKKRRWSVADAIQHLTAALAGEWGFDIHNDRTYPLDRRAADALVDRRALAVLYSHAKTRGKKPAKIRATVGEGDEKTALIESAAENAHRLPPPLMDQARLFKRMTDAGMTDGQIAKVYPMGKDTAQVIRLRLRLLKCPEEVQQKVHLGKMTQEAALKIFAERNAGRKKAPVVQAKQKQRGLVPCAASAALPVNAIARAPREQPRHPGSRSATFGMRLPPGGDRFSEQWPPPPTHCRARGHRTAHRGGPLAFWLSCEGYDQGEDEQRRRVTAPVVPLF
jgi:hypothetical protein